MDLKVKTTSGGDYVRPDNGYYLLRFDGLEDAGEWDAYDKSKGKVLKLRMNFAAYDHQTRMPLILTEGELAGQHQMIKELMNQSAHIKSNLYMFGAIILGYEPEEDAELGELLAEKVGTLVVGQVGNNEAGKPGKLKVLMPDLQGGDVGASPAPPVATTPAPAQSAPAQTATEAAIPTPPTLPGAGD